MGTKITGTNTAANPGVTGDDTDTGLFYGTNEIGFSTSGTERLKIAASGQIGIAGANYGSAGQVLTSGGSSASVSWATASGGISDVVSDTTPQLGGNLDVNAKNIVFGDSGSASDDRLVMGAGTDLSLYHDGTHNRLLTGANLYINNAAMSETIASFIPDGACALYHNDSKKIETSTTGIAVTGHVTQDGGFGIMEPGFVCSMVGDEQIDHSTNHKFVNWTNYTAAYNPGWDGTNDKFTVPTGGAGKYLFGWKLAIGDNHQQHLDEDEFMKVWLNINGGGIGRSETRTFGNSGNAIWQVGTAVWDLADADYIEMYAWHDEGARVDINDDYSLFWGFRFAEGD